MSDHRAGLKIQLNNNHFVIFEFQKILENSRRVRNITQNFISSPALLSPLEVRPMTQNACDAKVLSPRVTKLSHFILRTPRVLIPTIIFRSHFVARISSKDLKKT
jgi:hypothetical protein